ncbi:hypothetical protein HXX76_007685 [Chlamydomonas incerta]|uniref:Aminotransferase class V domain-containing protein n=1 Tax=Chlamydomonas incerta TaxID=51695 RepID=A0A835W0J8_CHLIN|nr:hypothetical protein HXX76_007685 [Chlamydomonas incerta]|eukprot:KAG2434800.1 hypothetical protein HXX76_007685 [Chlamydomonas incerta]
MGGVADIARHFGLKAVYVLVAWGVTRVLEEGRKRFMRRRRRRSEETGADPAEAAAQPAAEAAASGAAGAPAPGRRDGGGGGGRYRLYRRALAEYTPSNPGWLREAVGYDAAALATDMSWQCPLLIQFLAKMAGQPGGPPLTQAVRPAVAASAPATGAAAGPLGITLGKQARKQLFALEPEVTYLNHGSYGAAFRLALEVQQWYQQQLEAQPVRFMETVALKALVAAVADAARFVGASPADVVPVTNATTAVNAVLAAVPLRRGDWVLMFNTTYPAVKSTIARVAAAAGASVIEVTLGMEELQRPALAVGAMQSALAALGGGGRRVRLAVLDHVASFPPLVMPVAAMTAVLKQVGATVLVDGAHAVGNVPGLQVPALGCDYYTTNLHKWGCSPKGAALLWAAPGPGPGGSERQAALRPLVTSHGFGLGFRGEWLWQGTSDMSSWLAVPAALAVLRGLGGPERLTARNAALVADAAAAMRRRWQAAAAAARATAPGTATAAPATRARVSGNGSAAAAAAAVAGPHPDELLQLGGGGDWAAGGGAPCMLAVQVPEPLRGYVGCGAAEAVALQRWLRYERGIEVPVVAAMGRLWVRLSAAAYNEPADYEALAAAVEELVRPQGGGGGVAAAAVAAT